MFEFRRRDADEDCLVIKQQIEALKLLKDWNYSQINCVQQRYCECLYRINLVNWELNQRRQKNKADDQETDSF